MVYILIKMKNERNSNHAHSNGTKFKVDITRICGEIWDTYKTKQKNENCPCAKACTSISTALKSAQPNHQNVK